MLRQRRSAAARLDRMGLSLLIATTALAGCSSSDSPTDEGDDLDPVDAVEVAPGVAELDVGEARTFTVTVRTEGGANVTATTSVTWSSEDPSVATVDGSGASAEVTALAQGVTEIRATAEGVTGSADVTVSLAAPTITTASLPAGEVGVAYDQTLQAEGGDGTYAWSIAGGSLPPGISLDAGSGVVSGTPTSAGTYPFTVQVASGELSDDQELEIEVTGGASEQEVTVVNVDFMSSVLPQFGDEVHVGDDGVFSTAGGTVWNGADATTSVADALDEFGQVTTVELVENVPGVVFIGAASTELQDHGVTSGDVPENGLTWQGLVEGETYDLAFYVDHQDALSRFTRFRVTHAEGTVVLETEGDATWTLPGDEGNDYLLLPDVRPTEVSTGVWGFVVDQLNDDGAILGLQLRGLVRLGS